MKVRFLVAGAIGGCQAGHVARAAGCEVSVIARGAHLEAIRRYGLRVLRSAETLDARGHFRDPAAHHLGQLAGRRRR